MESLNIDFIIDIKKLFSIIDRYANIVHTYCKNVDDIKNNILDIVELKKLIQKLKFLHIGFNIDLFHHIDEIKIKYQDTKLPKKYRNLYDFIVSSFYDNDEKFDNNIDVIIMFNIWKKSIDNMVRLLNRFIIISQQHQNHNIENFVIESFDPNIIFNIYEYNPYCKLYDGNYVDLFDEHIYLTNSLPLYRIDQYYCYSEYTNVILMEIDRFMNVDICYRKFLKLEAMPLFYKDEMMNCKLFINEFLHKCSILFSYDPSEKCDYSYLNTFIDNFLQSNYSFFDIDKDEDHEKMIMN